MYRSVLALLFASVLLLSGCAVGQQTVPKEKSGQETNMDGAAFDRSDEEITYIFLTFLICTVLFDTVNYQLNPGLSLLQLVEYYIYVSNLSEHRLRARDLIIQKFFFL